MLLIRIIITSNHKDEEYRCDDKRKEKDSQCFDLHLVLYMGIPVSKLPSRRILKAEGREQFLSYSEERDLSAEGESVESWNNRNY